MLKELLLTITFASVSALGTNYNLPPYAGYNDNDSVQYDLQRIDNLRSGAIYVDNFTPNVTYYYDRELDYFHISSYYAFNQVDEQYNTLTNYPYMPSVSGDYTTRYFKGFELFTLEQVAGTNGYIYKPYYLFNVNTNPSGETPYYASGYFIDDNDGDSLTFARYNTLGGMFVYRSDIGFTTYRLSTSGVWWVNQSAVAPNQYSQRWYFTRSHTLNIKFTFYDVLDFDGNDILRPVNSLDKTISLGDWSIISDQTSSGGAYYDLDISEISEDLLNCYYYTIDIDVMNNTLGYQQGYDVGYTAGYNAGYDAGSLNGASFTSLLFAIADTPILMLRSLFNFDVLGVNLLVVAMSLMTGVIVLYIVKKFLL